MSRGALAPSTTPPLGSVAERRNEGEPMTEAAEAAPEVALPPFSGDHAVCAKCRNIGASITYQQAATYRQVDVFNGRRRHGPQPERLERECDRCDYQWDEALPTVPPSTDLPPDTPRLALLSALNSPPYDLAAGLRGMPLGEAVQLLDDYRAAVLREGAGAVAALDRRKIGIEADTIKDAWEEGRDEGADLLRRMADEATT